MHPNHWIYLIILGFLTALSVSVFEHVVYLVNRYKRRLITEYELSWISGYLLWILFCVFFTMISASIGEYISRDAEGSGIPEMKVILAGVNIYKYLSF